MLGRSDCIRGGIKRAEKQETEGGQQYLFIVSCLRFIARHTQNRAKIRSVHVWDVAPLQKQ